MTVLRRCLVALVIAWHAASAAQTTVLDEFDDASRWQVGASDQVQASVRRSGGALSTAWACFLSML